MCSSNRPDCKSFDSPPGQLEGIHWPLGIQFKLQEFWSSQTKDMRSQVQQKGWHQALMIQTGAEAGAEAPRQDGAGLVFGGGAGGELLWVEMESTRERGLHRQTEDEEPPHLGSH